MSSPPRLTYLITGTQYGGATIGMVRLLSGLEPNEYDVTVVSLTDAEQSVVPQLPEHVNFQNLGLKNKIALHRLFPLKKLLSRTDILVCSAFHAAVVGVPFGDLLSVPLVLVWQHNSQPRNKFRANLYNLIYRRADCVLADSESVKSMVETTYGIHESKISVLPIAGVDTGRFCPSYQPKAKKNTSIGTVGRLTPEKGYKDLVSCAEILGEKFQFHIAGDGPERDWLEANSPPNITLHGSIPNHMIPKFLNQHHIYFQPSKTEGLCMTVIEAMACELPVVASQVGGIAESVNHEQTGFVCPSGSIKCFCNYLENLAENEVLRDRMGSAGRRRVKARYSQSALAQEFRKTVHRHN